MCVAVVDNNGLEREWFELASDINDDGFGVAWSDMTGKVRTYRSMLADYQEYIRIREKVNGPLIVHFRMATSGPVTIHQVHPFVLGRNTALVHNGVIAKLSGIPGKSDTQVLSETLRGANPKSHKFRNMMDKICATFNKIIVLHQGEPIIFGEKHGDWEADGNWYSALAPSLSSSWINTTQSEGCTWGCLDDYGNLKYKDQEDAWSEYPREVREWDNQSGYSDYLPAKYRASSSVRRVF